MSISPQIAANLLTSVVSQAIIKPLGNPYTIGVSGLIFDIMDVIDVSVEADITDHYVEQNYAIQDHISQKPVIITLKGYAAEQVAYSSFNLSSPILSSLQGLIPLAGLGPSFNSQDSQFYSELEQTAQVGQNVVNSVQSLFELSGQGATAVTRQQYVYQFLFGLWKSRTLCVIETPWAIYENMAIQSLRPTQTGETVFISEFLITFKQILTVAAIQGTVSVNSTQSQNTGTNLNVSPVFGGAGTQLSTPTTNLGVSNGVGVDSSGNTFTVANVSQNTYIQQISPPETF